MLRLPISSAVVIHWTRQIKELLAAPGSQESTEGAGPLSELEYWTQRCDDLSGMVKVAAWFATVWHYIPLYSKTVPRITMTCQHVLENTDFIACVCFLSCLVTRFAFSTAEN